MFTEVPVLVPDRIIAAHSHQITGNITSVRLAVMASANGYWSVVRLLTRRRGQI